ncbi:MAG: T9SS type A sorting domain-containing protein [candidate division Zixibacteria bacterium]|nr:T9SS type A sorting domain-containing protein [candidate division Zixibacteria bacterium]
MRWSKLLLVVLAVAAVAGPAHAQIRCANLPKSSKDTIQTKFFSGKPGDTVSMPFYLKNDSIVTTFQFLIQYDTTVLRPAFKKDSICDSTDQGNCVRYFIDSGYVGYTIADRFVRTQVISTPLGDVLDTITKFQASLFTGTRNVIAANFLPQLSDFDSIPKGGAVIFYLKFIVNPLATHGKLAAFKFFESDIFTVVDTVFPPDTTYYDGCNTSQMVIAYTGAGDTTTQSVQIYPTFGQNQLFRVDTSTVTNPTITLSANPTNISNGGTSVLSWTATNADSVVIRDVGAGHWVSTSLVGTQSVSPSVTTTYTGTAYHGASKFATAQATVTVGTSTSCMSLSFTPSLQTYTINQGETVAFQVRASSSTTGQTVSLTASSLPNNATLSPTNPVVGTTTATGNFSFTPDFNQQGAFTVNFSGSAGCGSAQSSVLIVVNALEKDRLFSTSAPKQKPVGGLRGTPGIRFPINLISSKTVYGVQFDMDFPVNYVSIDSFTVTNRIADYVVYDNLGEFPGTVRVTTFGLQNDSVKTDVSSAILYAYMTLDSNAVPWTTYPINMRNGRESVNPDPNLGTLELQTDSGVVECDNPGDVNLDKIIDVGDLVNIVAYIIGNFGLTERQFATADLIVNDSVNVFDLVADINVIYGRPINPAPPAPAGRATVALAYNDIPSGSASFMTVHSDLPQNVAGVQMDIAYDPNSVALGIPHVSAPAMNYVLQYKDYGSGKMTVLLYHPNPQKYAELLQAGIADLVNIPLTAKADIRSGDKTKLRITQALLATPSAASIAVSGVEETLPQGFELEQNYPNPFNPVTTIEYSLGYFEDGAAVKHVTLEVYNVLGQMVKRLVDTDRSPGSYREEWDATNLSGQRVSSGVYLYRLQVGNESQTKKMLLLK